MCVRTKIVSTGRFRHDQAAAHLRLARGERSESLAVARTFLDTFRQVHPAVAVDTYDLWDGTLPAFGPDAAAAKMAIFAGEEPGVAPRSRGRRRPRPSAGTTPQIFTCSAFRCGTPACRTS
jgi:hypothetical protein